MTFMTAERAALAETVRDFTADQIAPSLDPGSGGNSRDLHKQAAAPGLLGVGYPEEVGGSGGDLGDVIVVTESVLAAGGSGGVIAGLFTHGIAIPATSSIPATRTSSTPGCARSWPARRSPASASPNPVADPMWRIFARVPMNPVTPGCSTARRPSSPRVHALMSRWSPRACGRARCGRDRPVRSPHRPAGFQVTSRLEKMGWHCSDTAEIGLVDARAELITDEGFASLARHFATERLSLV